MKIEKVTQNPNLKIRFNNNTKSIIKPAYPSIDSLSDFPKSYIKFNPSFSASLEDELNLETEANRNKRKDDYLWARNWDQKKAWEEAYGQSCKISHQVLIGLRTRLVAGLAMY